MARGRRNASEQAEQERYVPVLDSTVATSLTLFSKFFDPINEGRADWKNNFNVISKGYGSNNDRTIIAINSVVKNIQDSNQNNLSKLLEEIKKVSVKLLNPRDFVKEIYMVLPVVGVDNYTVAGSSIEGGFFKNFLKKLKSSITEIEAAKDSFSKPLDDEEVKKVTQEMIAFIDEELTEEKVTNVTSTLSSLQKYSKLYLEQAGKDWHEHFARRERVIKAEIRSSEVECKIFWLRIFMYIIPMLYAVGILCLIQSTDWSIKPDALMTIGRIGLIEIGLSGLILVSTLSYHLRQSLRELNVLKHMRSSYLHRAIVAKTFQSLLASGTNFQDRNGNVVIQEAAMAMFGRESHGYLSKDQMESSNAPVQVVAGHLNRGS